MGWYMCIEKGGGEEIGRISFFYVFSSAILRLNLVGSRRGRKEGKGKEWDGTCILKRGKR